MQDLAEELGVSESRISQMRAEALALIKDGMNSQLEPEQLDLTRFARRAAEARALSEQDPERAASILREALTLWRGPALAEFAYEPFAQVEIGRLEELRWEALELCIDCDLAVGRGDLVAELQALVSAQPLRERLREQLIDQRALPGDGFVPLAAVVPVAAGR